MAPAVKAQRWMEVFRPSPNPSVRLICFPHAGGSAAMYRPWVDRVAPWLDIHAAALPGRGARCAEAPFTRIERLVEAVAPHVAAAAAKTPVVLFGHSMGAMVAFETARYLSERGETLNLGVAVSGCRAPHLRVPIPATHLLPDAELIDHLRRMKGTPDAILDDSAAMQLFLPIIRADFELVQQYNWRPGHRFGYPLLAIGGAGDRESSNEALLGWQLHTSGRFLSQQFPGGHFYLEDQWPNALRSVVAFAAELQAAIR